MEELAESASRISPRPHIPNRQPLGSPKSSIVPFDLFKEKYIIEKKKTICHAGKARNFLPRKATDHAAKRGVGTICFDRKSLPV